MTGFHVAGVADFQGWGGGCRLPPDPDKATLRAVLNAAGGLFNGLEGDAGSLGWAATEASDIDPDSPSNNRTRQSVAFFLDGAGAAAITADAITVGVRGRVHRISRHGGGFKPPSTASRRAS